MHSHCGALLSLFILFSVQLNAIIKANGTQLLDSLITWNADGSSGKQSDTHAETHTHKHALLRNSQTSQCPKNVSVSILFICFIYLMILGILKILNLSHEFRERERRKPAFWKHVCFFAVHMTTECSYNSRVIRTLWQKPRFVPLHIVFRADIFLVSEGNLCLSHQIYAS